MTWNKKNLKKNNLTTVYKKNINLLFHESSMVIYIMGAKKITLIVYM